MHCLDNDMDGYKADVVVMEIFDTELIGEGVLGTMLHAQQNLIKVSCYKSIWMVYRILRVIARII